MPWMIFYQQEAVIDRHEVDIGRPQAIDLVDAGGKLHPRHYGASGGATYVATSVCGVSLARTQPAAMPSA